MTGYGCTHYLLTPFRNLQTPGQQRYNHHQIRCRIIVEKAFGIYKIRFPAMQQGLRTRLELAKKIIVATAILHNMAILAGISIHLYLSIYLYTVEHEISACVYI